MNELAPIPAASRTYGALEMRAGHWVITALEPHVSIRLKQIFPRIPKTDVAPFTMQRSPGADADMAWFLQRYPLRMDEATARALADGHADYLRRQAQMEAILIPTYAAPALAGFKPGYAERHYQRQAIDLVYESKRLLVGDDCGLGKTITGTVFCLMPGTCPAAVVCQGHIQQQWIERIQEFTTLRVHEVKSRLTYSLPPADVYVFRYTQIMGNNILGSVSLLCITFQ
ncbi:MAG: hypothetical protein WDN04_13900 [Rhodospirillales bacterium]